MSLLQSIADRVFGLFNYVRVAPADQVRWENRTGIYTVNDLLYRGEIYQTRANGGALEDVLKTFIGAGYTDVNRFAIQPLFMPFAEIVEAYQYVLPGTWGKTGVRVAAEVNERPVNPRILDPLASIWRASNLDTEKSKLIRWTANFGTLGLRVSARAADGDKPARVSIKCDHPSKLFNFEEDGEGNVMAVCLKSTLPINRGTLADPTWEDVEVVETLDKDEFSLKYNGAEQLKDGDRKNGLGFCPYVVLRHKDNGTPYGDWAYRGSEAAVHRINFRMIRQDKSIDRHQFPKWFGAAGGAKPIEVPMEDTSLTYIELHPDTPTPFLQAIVGDINQPAAQAFWMELIDMLRTRQPELNLQDVKLLGNTSGEALSRILMPSKKAIGDARPGYWHAIIRAMQMGLSAGAFVNAFDLGTGMGTKEAGDRAFRSGVEDFTFADLPLLPPTLQEMLDMANADVAETKAKLGVAQQAKALGMPQREQWRMAGKSEEDIVRMEAELRKQDVLPEEGDGEDEL